MRIVRLTFRSLVTTQVHHEQHRWNSSTNQHQSRESKQDRHNSSRLVWSIAKGLRIIQLRKRRAKP